MKFRNKVQELRYKRHLLEKYKRLEELRHKIDLHGEIKSAREYMVIANGVFGKDRIESRRRVIKRISKFNNND